MGLGLSAGAVTEESWVDRADESPATGILTLPAGALRTPATMTIGGPAEIYAETESLLRGRLQVGAWMIVLGFLGFVLKELVDPPLVDTPPGLWVRLLGADVAEQLNRFGGRAFLLLFYGAIIVLLRSPRRLSLRQLRVVEAAIVWVMALWLVSDRVYWTRRAIDERDEVATLWAVAFAVMIYFALLSGYGLFAPNAWKRALWMTGLLALTPVAIVVYVGAMATDGAGAAFLMEQVTVGYRLGMGLTLGIGVMIAT
ncbi:MAG: hypothetical protein IH849_11575, partial [Acidobacteria bacterium]|nr:hypothetical protein [Acidobacteriota bacterium]